ncbi:hypothetical protein N8760_05295 [Rhodobacteraceae bacterium]|nr:hypothetical protein [Paracoccaceae bacterium]
MIKTKINQIGRAHSCALFVGHEFIGQTCHSTFLKNTTEEKMVVLHLNLQILPHKAAAGLKGGAHHIAPRCALEPTIKTLGISAYSVQLIGMAQNLNHQRLA